MLTDRLQPKWLECQPSHMDLIQSATKQGQHVRV
jgi:hypothetical protein